MADQWFCRIDGVVRGPASFAELKKLADAGKLAPADFVRRDSQPNWLRASEVGNLWLRLPTATLPHDAAPTPKSKPAREAPSAIPPAEDPSQAMVGDALSAKLARALAPPPAVKTRAAEKEAMKVALPAPPPPRARPLDTLAANQSPTLPSTPAAELFPAARLKGETVRRKKPSVATRLLALGVALFALAVAIPILLLWSRDQAREPVATTPVPTEQTLAQLAADLNSQAPMVWSPGLRADSVTANFGVLTFNCTLTELDSKVVEFVPAVFVREMKPKILAAIRALPQRDFLIRQGADVRFQFHDQNGRDVTTVVVSATEL